MSYENTVLLQTDDTALQNYILFKPD